MQIKQRVFIVELCSLSITVYGKNGEFGMFEKQTVVGIIKGCIHVQTKEVYSNHFRDFVYIMHLMFIREIKVQIIRRM